MDFGTLLKMVEVDGFNPMAGATEAFSMAREAEAKMKVFDEIGHILRSKFYGCSFRRGCPFHKKQDDKLPRKGWRKALHSGGKR